MILVATGTTGFDALIREMDRLAPGLGEAVVMQIGEGQYFPRQAEYFRLTPSLQPYYEQASLVISHGGMGICLEVLDAGKPLVAVNNIDRYDQHQADILSALEAQEYLIWCRELDQLAAAIATARQTIFRPYRRPECSIHLRIREFLDGRVQPSANTPRRWPGKAG
jgi:UDP-N-acetylglucosamine transferase subunit ALG13